MIGAECTTDRACVHLGVIDEAFVSDGSVHFTSRCELCDASAPKPLTRTSESGTGRTNGPSCQFLLQTSIVCDRTAEVREVIRVPLWYRSVGYRSTEWSAQRSVSQEWVETSVFLTLMESPKTEHAAANLSKMYEAHNMTSQVFLGSTYARIS